MRSAGTETTGVETLWSVLLDVSPSVAAGELLLILHASFADGGSVAVDAAVIVMPPAAVASNLFP